MFFIIASPVRGGSLWQHSTVRMEDTKPMTNRVMAMDSGGTKYTNPTRISLPGMK